MKLKVTKFVAWFVVGCLAITAVATAWGLWEFEYKEAATPVINTVEVGSPLIDQFIELVPAIEHAAVYQRFDNWILVSCSPGMAREIQNLNFISGVYHSAGEKYSVYIDWRWDKEECIRYLEDHYGFVER